MNQNASIGEKIKALRTSQNMTLKQLSEKTNLSTGFLSQMERGMSSIAIDTLENIAGVLGVSLTSFFDEEPVKDISDPVVHSFALPAVQVGSQIIQHILSHDVSSFDFLPRIFTLLPLANTAEENLEMYTHNGEEFIYILEGIATIQVGSSQYTLYPGDSIQIHSNESHNTLDRVLTRLYGFLLSTSLIHFDMPKADISCRTILRGQVLIFGISIRQQPIIRNIRLEYNGPEANHLNEHNRFIIKKPEKSTDTADFSRFLMNHSFFFYFSSIR